MYQMSQKNCNGCLSRSKLKVSCDLWQAKATITPYNLSPRFFCIDAASLCEFESNRI